MVLSDYIADFPNKEPYFGGYENPWDIINNLEEVLRRFIQNLPPDEYILRDNIAIHKSAVVEANVTIKDFAIVAENCEIRAGAYIRKGLLLFKNSSIGANCEVKQSIIFEDTSLAHLNYVGNSILGSHVNIEAGAVLANHFNERSQKEITVKVEGQLIRTSVHKFGSLLGDHCKIGANAVLNPGTILPKASIVNRLAHIDQLSSS